MRAVFCTILAALLIAGCGRKGNLERVPGEPVPEIAADGIDTRSDDPDMPRSTLF